jgi:hypothetical protein
MGPRGFWIALAIVLFYVIARPHVGTVWSVNADGAQPPIIPAVPSDTATPSNPFLVDATPTPPPVMLRPDAPKVRFTDRRDCLNAAVQYEREANLIGVYCASNNALLWGW